MRLAHTMACLGVVVVAMGCQQQPQSAGQLSAADEATVHGMADSTVAWFKSGNFKSWAAMWTDDAVLQPPNGKAVTGGPVGFEAWGKAFPPVESLSFSDVKVMGDGNIAYGTTTYALKVQGAPADTGKQLFVARRQADGTWKLVAGSFNSDLPAPMAAPAPANTKAAPQSKGRK